MVKKICIIVLFLFAAKPFFGQGFKFGVFFNPAVTWLKSDVQDIKPQNAHPGFDFGMSVNYFFAQNYAFATGVSLFNTSGTLKYENGATFKVKNGEPKNLEQGENIKFRIQYVKIPIGLKFKTHRIGRMIYSANLGFDPMIRTTQRADFKEEKKIDLDKEIKFFNMGWHFGGIAAYSLGGEAAVYGGLAFMNTFTDITQHSRDKISSGNVMLRIGVLF